MIVAMARIRVMGPSSELATTVASLQDLGLVHLAPPPDVDGLSAAALTESQERTRAGLQRRAEDLEHVLGWLGGRGPGGGADGLEVDAAALRATAEEWADEQQRLREEQALVGKYRELLRGVEALFQRLHRQGPLRAYHLVLRSAAQHALEQLRAALQETLGPAFELVAHRLSGGEVAVALLVPASEAETIDSLLVQAALEKVPVPAAYGDEGLMVAMPRMLARLREIPEELEALEARRAAAADRYGGAVHAALAATRDALVGVEVFAGVGETRRTFVLDGWLPDDAYASAVQRLHHALGPAVAIERVPRDGWPHGDAPIHLRNRRIVRPFELLTALLPLPRYATVDATPFIALSFPLLYGIIVGDIGYAAVLGVLSLVVGARSRPGSTLRSVAEISALCAASGAVFGAFYGELFGDLGHLWWGMTPLLFDRAEATALAIIVSIGLGIGHLVLGLILGAASRSSHDRHKRLGRAATALALVVGTFAVAAAVGVLPREAAEPLAVVAGLAIVAVVVSDGLLAIIELVMTVGHVLSYVRIMAVGTASLTMAVAINQIAGSGDNLVLGVAFAVIFHTINLALCAFSPTVHALRLHFVEFNGTYFSPGGTAYRPFRRSGATTIGQAPSLRGGQEEGRWKPL